MVKIKTFVMFDLETTGLPHKENNNTKIIELCMMAVSRKDILKDDSDPPLTTVLSFLLNPAPMKVDPYVVTLTGIDAAQLSNCPSFGDKFVEIENFLQCLPKPVCLVAHNGILFDYPIINAEMNDAKVELPHDIICVDTWRAFIQLDKKNLLCEPNENAESKPNVKAKRKRGQSDKKSYSLTALHDRLTQTNFKQTHRAADDCNMLLNCIIAAKTPFVKYADRNAKRLTSIPGLLRNSQI